jgi:hypothetical protein
MCNTDLSAVLGLCGLTGGLIRVEVFWSDFFEARELIGFLTDSNVLSADLGDDRMIGEAIVDKLARSACLGCW